MTLPNESDVQVIQSSGGPLIRNLLLTTIINGVPTQVQMQVIAISDSFGNVIDDFMDYQWKAQVIHELRMLRMEMAQDKGRGLFENEPSIGGMR